MPLCTLYLLSLHPTTPHPLQSFLLTLQSTNLTPLVISRVIRWVILPTKLSTDTLLAQNIHWDLLLILPSTEALPRSLTQHVKHQWTVTAGVPSKLLQDFAGKNKRLLHPDPESVPRLTVPKGEEKVAESAQGLELSTELRSWIQQFSSNGGSEGRGAVSMLNLLSFKPDMKSSYLKYGEAFARSIGSKRGGNAKIVGTVVDVEGDQKSGWDEVALAHYPSIQHFADMLGSQDYQEVNHEHRIPALRDTFILCTSEIGIDELINAEKGSKL